MTQITLNIKDSKIEFFMELIRNFSFVKVDQQDEDKNIEWSKDMSSSELAYVLYQVPVLVAVHATEMLPQT